MTRLGYLDALRGLAVLMVMMVHSLELVDLSAIPSILANFLTAGKYGVQLFFVISAFTLFYTSNAEKKTNLNFYLRRFFRIAPAYYVAILLYSAYQSNWNMTTLLNFGFLHGFSPKAINSVVPGGWSVGIEVMFYVVVPFLVSSISSLPRAILFLVLSIVLRIIFFQLITLGPLSQLAAEGSFLYFWLPNQLPVFAVGIITYWYVQGSFPPAEEFRLSIFLLLSVLLFGIFTQYPILPEHLVVSFVFAAIIATLAKLKNRTWLENKPLLWVGKISYSAYLCQYAVIILLKNNNIFESLFDRRPFLNLLLQFSLFGFLTMLLAYVLYRTVEKPVQRLGIKLIAGLRTETWANERH